MIAVTERLYVGRIYKSKGSVSKVVNMEVD